jgi:iron-sulfur cluster repair protein YtfE (RIC family)
MDLTDAQRSQKQWLLFNILNKSNKKNIALILASVNVISLPCSVPYIIERYHERRRERPNETLATLIKKVHSTLC